ncbi:MAG: Mrp/NBP35 family ATP-binding protein [Candidatus Bipolaricaulaceae bacterium]
MKRARQVLMVLSGKGGVGKSTVAANLACALGRSLRVGLLDADLHGPNVPKMLGIDRATMPVVNGKIRPVPTEWNLAVVSMAFGLPSADTPLIWRGPLKMKAIRQFIEDVDWGDLDLLVVDLPPGTGDEPLSVVQVVGTVDAALVVTTPQQVALLDAGKAVSFCRKVGVGRVGVVENMAALICPHCGGEIDLFGRGGAERMAASLGATFLGRLPMSLDVVRAGDAGRPVVAEDSPAREPFLELALRALDFVRGEE